jgi:hypothetical protein
VVTDIAHLIARARLHDPEAALELADLVEARLVGGSSLCRGGDSKADDRAERNDAIRALAGRLDSRLSRSQRAAIIADKINRYRLSPNDAFDPGERGLLFRIWRTGLTRIRARQVRRILSK